MDAYTGFAEVYDEFMEDVPYGKWRDLVVAELKKEGITDWCLISAVERVHSRGCSRRRVMT